MIARGARRRMLVFEDVKSPDDFRSEPLKRRARESRPFPGRIDYRVTCDGSEIAFVTCIAPPNRDYLVLYELFVEPPARRRGYGTATLREVERMAKKQNRSRITLNSSPLDETSSRDDLIRWYTQLGFSQRREVPGELEKVLR